jgi:toxin ParE1/3/4
VSERQLRISEAAASDILEQSDWYEAHSGARLVARWQRAVTVAILHIVKNPGSGALCRFQAAGLRGVRRTFIAGFPKHLVFYTVEEGELLVLRVLHGARDLERLF